MLELLAAIQSAEPTNLVLWSVVALAAGMYPVGFMLGSSCSPCCCGCPEGESLPEYISTTFSGLTQGRYKQEGLLHVTITADFGSGATATANAPGGNPEDAGPITKVTLTSGGSGYARLKRVAPTLSATCPPGTGATFTVTTTKVDGPPAHWKISEVKVSGGTGYRYDDPLVFTVAEGDTVEQTAQARIVTGREEPTLSVDGASGTGAILVADIQQNYGSNPVTWVVTGVAVTNGGQNYDDATPAVFTLGQGDICVVAAEGVIRTFRVEPTLAASVDNSGSGAVLSVSLSPFYEDPENAYPVWSVAAVGVTEGGSGYAVGDPVTFTVTDGVQYLFYPATAEVESVDENGAILSVSVSFGGGYVKDSGVIFKVEMTNPGEYFHDTGVPQSVIVDDGGKYYRDDPTLPPDVANIQVEITQTDVAGDPGGTGAVVQANVEQNPSSPQFGQIISLTLAAGGDGYREWAWVNVNCCAERYNGRTYTLKRRQGEPCVYETIAPDPRCRTKQQEVIVRYHGPNSPPTATLLVQNFVGEIVSEYPPCNLPFTATGDGPWPCEPFSWTGEDPLGGSITVAPVEESPPREYGECVGCCVKDGYVTPDCTESACSEAQGTWIDECLSCCYLNPTPEQECGGQFMATITVSSPCLTSEPGAFVGFYEILKSYLPALGVFGADKPVINGQVTLAFPLVKVAGGWLGDSTQPANAAIGTSISAQASVVCNGFGFVVGGLAQVLDQNGLGGWACAISGQTTLQFLLVSFADGFIPGRTTTGAPCCPAGGGGPFPFRSNIGVGQTQFFNGELSLTYMTGE